uniref:Uncharacterized protein n=1 Tax=Anguilla anguilla TaxID=7936 RepID=A0A0E9W658_ANGAN
MAVSLCKSHEQDLRKIYKQPAFIISYTWEMHKNKGLHMCHKSPFFSLEHFEQQK